MEEETKPQEETTEDTRVEEPPLPPTPSTTTKGQKFTSDSPSMSEILKLKKPNVRSCHILLDSSLAHEIQELQFQVEKLETKLKNKGHSSSLADRDRPNLEKLKEELEQKEEEAEEFTVEFKFQDIGRKKYDELVRDNRPTDEEKKEYKDAGGEGILQYSYLNFPPKLVAAASLEPKITLEEAEQIFEEWSEGDLEYLFTTALLACKEPTSLPKSRAGIAKTQGSEQNSTTALNGESPTPSS